LPRPNSLKNQYSPEYRKRRAMSQAELLESREKHRAEIRQRKADNHKVYLVKRDRAKRKRL
jgi:hypothetical protein